MNCITIRGTNGSGKSYGVRQLLSNNSHTVIKEDKDEVTFVPSLNAYIIGKYGPGGTGGLDTVSSFDRIKELVTKYIDAGHIIMEGLLWSGVYKTPHEFDLELAAKGHKMYWIYVDTSLELSVDRVMQRRALIGNSDPFKPQNVIAKHNSSIQAFNKAVRDGHITCYTDSGSIERLIYNILKDETLDLPNRGKILVNTGLGKYEGVKLVEQTNPVIRKPNNSSNLLDFT